MKTRMIVSFEPEQIDRLKRLARTNSQSVAELVRKAVVRYTEAKKRNPAALLLERVKEFEKKHKNKKKTDWSSRIDEVVYGI